MKLILVGKAAAGKDFLKNRLVAKNFKPGISCTTRLPRHNEVDGVDYHFMTEDQFKETITSGEMLEHMIFNNWYYGCLLYTSPSPRDATLSRMPSSA